MKYRPLGSTGITVSEIGFGTWGLGGTSYGPVDDAVSAEALLRALDLGVTFYDTADLYGNGHSEEILGRTFRYVRHKVIIATKGGTLPHSGFFMPQDFSPAHLRSALEQSLRRLCCDYVDLFQLHSPPREVLETAYELIETLNQLKAEGKIRAYGISARSPDDALFAVRNLQAPVIQVNFNLIDQRALENGLFEAVLAAKTGMIIRTPLCFGYLTGKLKGNEKLAATDHRTNWPPEQLQRWAEAPTLFSFLNNGKDRTPSQLALRYCLDFPAVSTVIPGMMNAIEVEENIHACTLENLSADELERISIVYQSNCFYDPTAKSRGKQ